MGRGEEESKGGGDAESRHLTEGWKVLAHTHKI